MPESQTKSNCLCHLSDVKPCAWSLVYMFFGPICLGYSLIQFKKGPEYITRGTAQVFILLMRFLLRRLDSKSFPVPLIYSFLTFSFVCSFNTVRFQCFQVLVIFFYVAKETANCFILWSRGGSNDNTTREWVIRNILKENSTYTNDSWEKPLLSLTQSWILTSVLGDGSPRLRRRELSRYISHEGESISRGDTPTLYFQIYSILTLLCPQKFRSAVPFFCVCVCVCVKVTYKNRTIII